MTMNTVDGEDSLGLILKFFWFPVMTAQSERGQESNPAQNVLLQWKREFKDFQIADKIIL